MTKIKVGIIGSAGYTGGELLRILIHHPYAEIVFAHSSSQAGQPVYNTHTDLLGDTDLVFSDIHHTRVDVLFLCVGHGDAKKFFEANPQYMSFNGKIIDLSQDFRNQSQGFVYGLPELNREKIKTASKIANPGCFATAIQLALLPLAAENALTDEVHISATTGSTGAGQSLSATSHFTWRNNNLSHYKAFEHQHLKEINQSIKQLLPTFDKAINFVPFRGAFTRGILAAVYVKCALAEEALKNLYKNYYDSHAFTHVSEHPIDVKQVVNTNKCLLHIEKHGDYVLITSIIDNLLKGASGQAVQNMNLMFGLLENEGLKLKPVAF